MDESGLRSKMLKLGVTSDEWDLVYYPRLETIYPLAQLLVSRLPSIGFASTAKRLNAVIAIFEYIDSLVDREGASEEDSLYAYLLARALSKSFDKAHTMFVIRSPRFNASDKVSLGKFGGSMWHVVNSRY